MKNKIILSTLLIFAVICQACLADVRMPAIFSDNMVLQQKTEIVVWGWASPDEKIKIKGSWSRSETKSVRADKNGKWSVKIKTSRAGGPFKLEIKGKNTICFNNIMLGEVWLCSGQSNMQLPVWQCNNAKKEIADANLPNIRLFNVKRDFTDEPKEDCVGSWAECSSETVSNFSGVAYFFGRELNQKLSVPVGLLLSCWGGTMAENWTPKKALRANSNFVPILERYQSNILCYAENKKKYDGSLIPEWKKQVKKAENKKTKLPKKPNPPIDWAHFHKKPSGLYNAMIAPIVPFTIKGVIWYQGESNSSRAHQYQTLFPALIKSWRDVWSQGDFPFYYVQIAPFRYTKYWEDWISCELREAQLMALSVTNTGMAVTMDIGNVEDIHPKNKLDVGKRLLLLALAKDYGYTNIIYSGPIYKSMKIEDDKIRLFFDFTGPELIAKGGPLTHFTIAASDKKFVEAKAEIQGDTIIVSNPKIKKPVAVRYGWTDTAEPNLFNKKSLPASSFRTDNWPGLTYNKL